MNLLNGLLCGLLLAVAAFFTYNAGLSYHEALVAFDNALGGH